MKILVIGIEGFVGAHLEQELYDHGHKVRGIDIRGNHIIADILNKDSIKSAIKMAAPDAIIHLAGQSSVARSWSNPQLTFEINVKGTLNLLDSVREINNSIKLLIIGSSDEYGAVRPEDCPITEDCSLNPVNPYAISKVTQEQLAQTYIKAYGMNIVLTRSFNHTGTGQPKGFVIPDFASQIVEIENGAKPEIRVGNLSAKRDFSDVRDVVRAYRLLIENGKAGEIYNVGSGNAYKIEELLQIFIDLSEINIRIKKDTSKFRPLELPIIQSNIAKLMQDTGYSPQYSISDTLEDTLNYWRQIRRLNEVTN